MAWCNFCCGCLLDCREVYSRSFREPAMSINIVYFLQGLRCSVRRLRTGPVVFRTACGWRRLWPADFARRLRTGMVSGTPADVAPRLQQLTCPPPSLPRRPTEANLRMYSDPIKDKETLLSMGFPLDRVECMCAIPRLSRCGDTDLGP